MKVKLWAKYIKITLFALGVVILGLRLSLLGKGVLSFPDEMRALYEVEQAHFKGNVFFHLAQSYGRPGDLWFRFLTYKFLNLFSSQTTPQLFSEMALSFNQLLQFIIAFANSAILFLIIQKHYLNQKISHASVFAWIWTLGFSFFPNSNLYIRHLFPYDLSLFYTLLAIFILQSQPLDSLYPLASGFLLGFSFITYPGYYWVPALALFFIQKKIRPWILLCAGYLGTFIVFETLARIGGRSLWIDLHDLSNTIIQGSFDEGFSFLYHYLSQTLGTIGILYWMIFVCSALYSVFSFVKKRDLSSGMLLMVCFVFVYYCFEVEVLKKFVFYGRTLHGFFIWTFIGLAFCFSSNKVLRTLISCLLLILGLISFYSFYRAYDPIHYTREVGNSIQVQRLDPNQTQRFDRLKNSQISDPRFSQFENTAEIKPQTRVILSSFTYPWPESIGEGFELHKPSFEKLGFKLKLDLPSYVSFTDYLFEGRKPAERDYLVKNPWRYQLWIKSEANNSN